MAGTQRKAVRPAQRHAGASNAASGGEFTPAVSRVVTYRLSAADVRHINDRRDAMARQFKYVPAIAGTGTVVESGEALPLLITRVSDGKVSGHVFLNGSDTWWVQNVQRGGDRGQWQHSTDQSEG